MSYYGDKSKPPFFEHQSLLKKVMTKDLWNEYKNQKCSKGVPFKMGIFPDIKIRDSSYGLVAGSTDFYKKFSKLYYNYIKEFLNFEPTVSKVLSSQFVKSSIGQSKSLERKFESINKNVPSMKTEKSYMISSK